MNTRWQQAGQKVKPGFKLAGKLVLLTALRGVSQKLLNLRRIMDGNFHP